jgi:alpha-beta hydrolase superfamily lysophospholipase
MKRRIGIAALAALLVAAVAVGWHYSGRILGPDAPPGRTGQTILARTDSTLTLASTPKARRPGHWAIVWPGGHGRIGPLLSVDSVRVVTRFEIASGTPPETTSRLAGFAMDADPQTWLGLAFDSVEIPSRVGPLPAWRVPGPDSTWAVFVHGRAATRAEVLRMLPAYTALGLPCLVISYRNDPDGPRVGDGSYRLGATEWEDLEDAVRWARERGARDVVVVGCSMGGGIVAHYLRKSSERSATRAAVLDAPALDWSTVISDQGRREGVPAAITGWGMAFSATRAGFRWDDLSHMRHAREFATPMLIFHGDADQTVPARTSEVFAAARPDLVTLHIVKGAGHVESANVDPERYAATIGAWLRRHGVGHFTSVDSVLSNSASVSRVGV